MFPLFRKHDADSHTNLKQVRDPLQTPRSPFYLLVGVLLPLASAWAPTKPSPLQPCPEDCPWAVEATLPKGKMPSSKVRAQGKGIKVLLTCSKARQTLQYTLCSKAWRGLVGTRLLPLPIPLHSSPCRRLPREHLQSITCTWRFVFGSVSRKLHLKCGLSSQDT